MSKLTTTNEFLKDKVSTFITEAHTFVKYQTVNFIQSKVSEVLSQEIKEINHSMEDLKNQIY